MRRIAVATICTIIMFSCTKECVPDPTTTSEIDLSKGLIAYYPFNGNTKDSSGNNKTGIAMNGLSYATDAHNNNGRAANFDGVDDYFIVPDATNYFAPSKLSISFQFNLRNVNARSSMISKSAYNTPSAVSYSSGLAFSNDPYFRFVAGLGDNPCSGLWNSAQGQGYELKANTVLQNNQWYHVTLIFNLGVHMIYFNGNLVSAKVGSYSYLNQCSSADLRIGAWWQNDAVSINGKIDEVRFYDRVLSENEIKELAKQIN